MVAFELWWLWRKLCSVLHVYKVSTQLVNYKRTFFLVCIVRICLVFLWSSQTFPKWLHHLAFWLVLTDHWLTSWPPSVPAFDGGRFWMLVILIDVWGSLTVFTYNCSGMWWSTSFHPSSCPLCVRWGFHSWVVDEKIRWKSEQLLQLIDYNWRIVNQILFTEAKPTKTQSSVF